MIDIVDIKVAVKAGEIRFEISKDALGNTVVYCYNKIGECVMVESQESEETDADSN